MKKRYKILITLLVIVSLCIGLVWWQFGNVRALYYWLKYSESDIDTLMSENSSKVETYLEKNSQYQVRPYNPVEEELHKKGVITDEELVELITEQTTIEEMFGTELELNEDKKITNAESGEKIEDEALNQLKQDAASASPSQQPSGETSQTGNSNNETGSKPADIPEKTPAPNGKGEETSTPDVKNEESKNTGNTEITSCIAQVYVIKSKFVGELDVIYNQAFSEYKALWYDMTDEQRTAKKKSLLSAVYPKAASLERDCDAQINQLLSNLTKLLKDAGEDTGLVDQIRSSYYNEKSLKKAHYLSLLT